MRILFIVLCICVSLVARSQVLIRNTTVVDVEHKTMLTPQDVLIKEGVIATMGKNLDITGAKQVIDGTGKWLMPGLVDAHIHFSQSGSIYTRPDAINLTHYKPYSEEIEWTHKNMEGILRRYLAAGITSVIDVGSTLNFLRQRDSFRTKHYAPTVYITGPLITTWQPPVFNDLGDNMPFFLMTTQDEARSYVQKQLPFKPDFIKVWYIVNGSNVDSAARATLALVEAVIDESHKNGLSVAVHATERITAMLAVQAGADYLVHGIEDVEIDDAFIQLLKTKKTVLSPTLVVSGNYGRSLGQTYTPSTEDLRYAHPHPVNTMYDLSVLEDTVLTKRYKTNIANAASYFKTTDSIRSLNLKKLVNAGVLIATGTDAGNIGTHHISSYYDELRAMQKAGMNNWSLIQASTINGAKAISKQNQFGSVKEGSVANLLLLSKNPVDDIDNWKHIDWVFNKGIALQPDSLRTFSPEELADQQLLAYNAHNLEAFLEPYSDDVEIFFLGSSIPNVKGKVAMRKEYSFLSKDEMLHCKLLNRVVQGNYVIDHEEITTRQGKFYGVAIYEVKNGKIARVWFTR